MYTVASQSPIASIVLQHFRWNKDRLLDRIMDSPSDVLREVGEPQNSATSPQLAPRPLKRARLGTPAEFMCAICCDTVQPGNAFELRCGHRYCRNCWTVYLNTKIRQEGQCFFKCMEDGCATTVDEPSIKLLVEPGCYDR
jgi:ariadne-1